MVNGAIAQQLRRLEREAEFSLDLVPTANKGGFLAELSCVFLVYRGKICHFRTQLGKSFQVRMERD
jgi:hypothetical protein